MRRARSIPAVLLVMLLVAAWAPAQVRDVTGLAKFDLENGLEVFVLENHIVPLARIQITFRCGAVAQSADTAGLFHLFEHMLFKGNRAYRTQTDFQAAMKSLGVADWNGGTSTEYVTYFFTVPSDKVEKGVEFWANAVRFPLLDPGELETEKEVVVNEIRGYLSDPGNIYESAVDETLFWKYPWRKDVSGYEKSIRAATAQTLRGIQEDWYVPGNAALFVGGDVRAEKVLEAVRGSFGDWESRKDPWATPPPSHPTPPNDALLVYPDDQIYSGVVFASLKFRGPDVGADPEATYAADVWGKMLEDPNGRFKSAIFDKVPGLYKKEYLWASYSTQRDGGWIDFSTYMLVSPRKGTMDRLLDLRKAILEEISAMAEDPDYFTDRDYDLLKRKLVDDRIIERETIDGFISDLSFWWASAGTGYYLGYSDNLARVTPGDLRGYLAGYLISRTSVLSARLNPEDFAREKSAAVKAGWTVISRDNAYWWAK